MVRTIRTGTIGSVTLRLLANGGEFIGVAFGTDAATKIQLQGRDPEELWSRLVSEVGKLDPSYVGYNGAINRFLHFFPNGLRSKGYENSERAYKLSAKSRLDDTVPLETALTETGFGEAILRVFQATNLLSPFEKVRLQNVLRGPGADAFVQGSARFAADPSASTLGHLKLALQHDGSAKWTVVTYLPFLWLPERHMFLKPEVTKDYASRVGHPLAHKYEAALDINVYQSLLDMADETAREIASLQPRDRIDIQSFIWVVGSYEKGRELPQD
jgi:hypothetical protein